MEFLGRIIGLTVTLVGAVMFLLLVLIFARAGLLDEAGKGLLSLLLLPVQIGEFLLRLGGAILDSFTSGGSGVPGPPTTTVP